MWPGDGRTYAYTDVVNYTSPHCPASFGSEIGCFSSPDGLSSWTYHGIVAHKNTSAADAGGLATPSAVVRGDGAMLLYFAYEGLPVGGGPRGIGVARAAHPLGPFVRLPPAAPAPPKFKRPFGPGGMLDDPQVFAASAGPSGHGAFHMLHSRKFSTDTPGCIANHAVGRNDCECGEGVRKGRGAGRGAAPHPVLCGVMPSACRTACCA